MKLYTVLMLSLSLFAASETERPLNQSLVARGYDVTQSYALDADAAFSLDAASEDYSELTDCEEDAK